MGRAAPKKRTPFWGQGGWGKEVIGHMADVPPGEIPGIMGDALKTSPLADKARGFKRKVKVERDAMAQWPDIMARDMKDKTDRDIKKARR